MNIGMSRYNVLSVVLLPLIFKGECTGSLEGVRWVVVKRVDSLIFNDAGRVDCGE